jgi:large subunit ribosomal protein L29
MATPKTKTVKTAKAAKAETALGMEALKSRLIDLKKEAMDHRFAQSTGQVPKTHVIRKTRREIARVKTAITATKKAA